MERLLENVSVLETRGLIVTEERKQDGHLK